MKIILLVGSYRTAQRYEGILPEGVTMHSMDGGGSPYVRARRFDVGFIEPDMHPDTLASAKELLAKVVRPATEIERLQERIDALEKKLESK